MKHNSLIIYILFTILTLNVCQGQDKNTWIEDIDFFYDQLPKKQIDFYKLIDSVEFKHEVDRLKNNIDALDEITIIIELQKIIALLHVSHSIIIPIQHPNFLYSLPIKLEIFDDGLFVIGIDTLKKQHLTQKVVAINNTPVEDIYKRLEPLISYENQYWLKNQIPGLMVKPQILEYINVIEKGNHVSFQLDNGENFKLPIEQAKPEMVYCTMLKELTWLKNQKKTYWHDLISNDVLYIQYNKCQEDKNYPFDKFVSDVASTINNNDITKIVVDLRLNSGGNSQVVQPLIQELQNYKDKEFYAAISKRTFSSGRFAARDLKVQLNAELIGEPTGGSPNSYGQNESLILPNSKIPINYCVKYFSLMDTDKNYFEPDIKITYNAKDLLEGKDLVLDYIKER